MRYPSILLSSALAAAGAAQALDIGGRVVDKRFAPLPGVQVCETAAPVHCALTGSDGTFRLQGITGLRVPANTTKPDATEPRAFSADGRAAAPASANESFGILYQRPGLVAARVTLFRPTEAREPGRAAKISAVPPASLTCSKTGYATLVWQNAADTATDAVLMMAGAGENVSAIFTGKSLAGWTQIPAASWVLKDGALASTGAGRGVAYSAGDYLDYRVIFSVRQISGDHWPCVLYFTQRPPDGQKGLDALGGVQWQAPSMNTWDYRPGKNNSGNDYYSKVTTVGYNRNQWAQCEIIARGSKGEARMGCCQAVAGPCKGVEMLRFKDPAAAGRKGPFALQMHNGGIKDEYKDISVEIDPKNDSLFIAR